MFLLGKSIFIPGPSFSQLCEKKQSVTYPLFFLWGREDVKFEQGGQMCKAWIVIVAIWEDTMNLGSRFYHVLDEQNLYSQPVQYQTQL